MLLVFFKLPNSIHFFVSNPC